MSAHQDQYLAVVLDKCDSDMLLFLFPPQYENVKCHHVTLAYDITPEVLYELFDMIDKRVKLEVVGYALELGIECLVVSLFGERHFHGKNLHITMSHSADRRPVDANHILDSFVHVDPIPVAGTLSFLPKSQ